MGESTCRGGGKGDIAVSTSTLRVVPYAFWQAPHTCLRTDRFDELQDVGVAVCVRSSVMIYCPNCERGVGLWTGVTRQLRM